MSEALIPLPLSSGPGSGSVVHFAGPSTAAVVGRGRSETGPGAFNHRVALHLDEIRRRCVLD